MTINIVTVESLRSIRQELAADNARQRHVEEVRFTADLEAYICNGITKRFSHGGVVNLLTTIADICAQRAVLDGGDYLRLAELITECAERCDE